MPTYEVHVLESWSRRGTVYADSLDEAKERVRAADERIFWHESEYVCEDNEDEAYMVITEGKQEVYRGK